MNMIDADNLDELEKAYKDKRKKILEKKRAEYMKEKYTRMSIFMRKEDAENVKQIAKEKGMSINGFIGEAVLYYMEQERG